MTHLLTAVLPPRLRRACGLAQPADVQAYRAALVELDQARVEARHPNSEPSRRAWVAFHAAAARLPVRVRGRIDNETPTVGAGRKTK